MLRDISDTKLLAEPLPDAEKYFQTLFEEEYSMMLKKLRGEFIPKPDCAW